MPDRLSEVAKSLASPLIVGAIGLLAATRQGKWRVPVAAVMVVAGVALFAFAFQALTDPWVQLGIAGGGFIALSTGAHFLARVQERKAEAKETSEREARNKRENEERETRLAREIAEHRERFDREEAERKSRLEKDEDDRKRRWEEVTQRLAVQDEERKRRWDKEDKRRREIFRLSGWPAQRRNALITDIEKRLKTEKDPKELEELKELQSLAAQVEMDYRKTQGST